MVLTEDGPFALECGRSLEHLEVSYETYGELNADGTNAIVVSHALTGDAHAAGHHGNPAKRGWWDVMIGPGRPLDTDRFFVIASNLLGGCQGTTGPRSIDPATGRRYGMAFPPLTVGDLVEVQRALCGRLGVRLLHAAMGGSLGGMQVLHWQLTHPGELGHAVIIGATGALSAQNIAFSTVARAAITRDPEFRGGDYEDGEGPDTGLAIARMMAHITYLSEIGMQQRFGRERRDGATGMPLGSAAEWLETTFEVESYLDHQGSSFLKRFDALTYLWMTRVMDFFEPFADRAAVSAALAAQPDARQLVLSFDSDWRFSPAHSAAIARELRAAGGNNVTHRELHSIHGHDAFLLPSEDYEQTVRAFLAGDPVPGAEPGGA
jgi:homoserine O-acetyltransferase